MALKKQATAGQTPEDGGVAGDYWIITCVLYEKESNSTTISYALYRGQEERMQSIHSAIYRNQIIVSGFIGSMEKAYNELKKLGVFEKAEDC